MQSSPFKKLLLLLMLLALGAALVLQFLNSRFKPVAPKPSASVKLSKSEPEYHYTPPVLSQATAKPGQAAADKLDENKLPQISREKAEAWLAEHNRNASSLLAVFRALGDTNYLNEAATNFPNDPQVELSVLAHNEFPEDRRKWLDLFKASSPSNSLANYLSAEDLFKNGKSDEAVKELLAASGRSPFQNYAIEAQLDGEELSQFSGKTPSDGMIIGLAGAAGDSLPLDATLKGLAHSIADVQQEKSGLGDTASVQNLAAMGLALADQIRGGDSGKLLINQLVGNATEAIMLSQLDQNMAYDFLGGQTPAQALQNMKDQRTALRDMMQNFSAIDPTLSDEERNAYFQRMKIYGELEAMKWVIQQHPPATPPQ